MITPEEIDKLAKLARIKLDPAEKAGMTKEIDSILAYVDEIKKATVNIDVTPQVGAVYNVVREDKVVTTSPEDRKALLDEAPDTEGDFVAVKKIIG